MNKKMSVTIAVTLMLGTAVLVAVGQRMTDSDRINMAAESIAVFDLPVGYETDYMIEALDYLIAAYKSADGKSHLSFVQTPSGMIPDDAVLAGYMTNTSRHQNWRETTHISTSYPTVRDHPSTLTITDRVNGEGEVYRSANLVFEGRNGTALLIINQPSDIWDADAISSFIASIR